MPLRRQQHITRRQAYKSGTSRSGIGPTTARYLILILLAVFSLMFLIESAQGSDALIQLQSLANQKDALTKEMTTLQVNASRLQSLQKLSQSASQQGLVPLGGAVNTLPVDGSQAKQ